MTRFSRRGKAGAVAVMAAATVGILVLSQAAAGHGTSKQAAGAVADYTKASAAYSPATAYGSAAASNGTANTASLAAATTGSTSPGDDKQFVNTFGEYIPGHPVDINSDDVPCYPSVPGCPQYPLVPGAYGWQNCGETDDLTDGCGYLFDNSTSSLVVRHVAIFTVGALAALCGPAAALCGGLTGSAGVYIGDHQDIITPGRCLYLHAPDVTDLWNDLAPLPYPVQARIVDCP